MVTSLTGTNSYLLSQRLNQLVADFKKRHGDLSVERINAAEAELASVMEAIQSLPFLATAKMVILDEPAANKQIAEAIEQIISSVPESTELIIIQPITDKRTVLHKIIRTKTNFEQFDNLDGVQLAKWLNETAKTIGCTLSLGDAHYLISRVGSNQALLANELNKLSLYSSEISNESIDLLTEKNPQSKVFDLLDAAFSGNKVKALVLYEEQRAQKVEPQAILALIAWQLNILALAKLGAGRSAANIAKDAKLNPYPIQKMQSIAAKITDEKLARMVSEAMEIDYKSKQSKLDIDEALKTFIATV